MVIYATSFATINGLSFVSVGGAAHRVSIVTRNICSRDTAGNVWFSHYATVTGSHLSVDAAEEITINASVDLTGKVTASYFAGSGSGIIGGQ